MQSKVIELRDAGTFIPMLAVAMESDNEQEAYLLRRAGYGPSQRLILFGCLDAGSPFHYSSDSWPCPPVRTYHVAHKWLEEHWDEVQPGDVIDVEHILGDRLTKKVSERFEYPE